MMMKYLQLRVFNDGLNSFAEMEVQSGRRVTEITTENIEQVHIVLLMIKE